MFNRVSRYDVVCVLLTDIFVSALFKFIVCRGDRCLVSSSSGTTLYVFVMFSVME